jgi:LPXTG-site transpeptidase (sortase) family protein
MALDNSETLDIRKLRTNPQHGDGPEHSYAHEPGPAYNAEKAAQARERIAGLSGHPTLAHPDAIPAAHTADLITDRERLMAAGHGPKTTKKRVVPSALGPILAAVGIFAIVLLLFKAPIILSQLGYNLGKDKPQAATQAGAIIPAENTITIPKINVHAPVIYQPSMAEADIQTSLQSGVVHYGSTALPGQVGNTAIFGHSSNDWWEPGNYKFVFVLLDKLAPGDQLYIDFQSKRYTYQVTGSQVVDPTDVAVLNSTPTPTLTLITCSPPGTSLRRLVVTAKQIDPNPNQAAPATSGTAQANNNLPSAAPSFFTQVKQAWDGVVHGFESLFGGDTSAPHSSPSPSSSASSPGTIPASK